MIKSVWTLFFLIYQNLNEIDHDFNDDLDIDFDTIHPRIFQIFRIRLFRKKKY